MQKTLTFYKGPPENFTHKIEIEIALTGNRLSISGPVCGYRYGSKWLTEKLPDEVVAKVKKWIED